MVFVPRVTAAAPIRRELLAAPVQTAAEGTAIPGINPDVLNLENFQKLLGFAEEYTPAVLPLLDHYTGQRPLFDLHGVEEEIQKALARRVVDVFRGTPR